MIKLIEMIEILVTMFIKSGLIFEFSFMIEATKPSFLKVLKTLCVLLA